VGLDLTVGIPDNYNAILGDINIYGGDRDTGYFKTEDSKLTSDEEFYIENSTKI
jgi:hypothetical protein